MAPWVALVALGVFTVEGRLPNEFHFWERSVAMGPSLGPPTTKSLPYKSELDENNWKRISRH
jgi:hypothetical protein